MASSHNSKTPVHSHPLSPEEIPSKGRRNRATPGHNSNTKQTTLAGNYFTLKAQLEQDLQGTPNWDGSVRGYGKAEKGKSVEGSSTSLSAMWDRAAPLFVVGSPQDRSLGQPNPEFIVTGETDLTGVAPVIASQVLATKWHTYSDEAIQASVSNFSASESPTDTPNHPYHTILRILSSAVYNLSRVRLELEDARKVLYEKELARRKRADELLKELEPSEQAIARRLIQSLFTDDDENEHNVHRKQSVLVRPYHSVVIFQYSFRYSRSRIPLLKLLQTRSHCHEVSLTTYLHRCPKKHHQCPNPLQTSSYHHRMK